jgi:UPF0176 protein
MKNPYTVILYYKYVRIDNPEVFTKAHKELCASLSLKGRIIIAHEGINGTLEGKNEDIEKYILEMKKDSRFSDMVFKKSDGLNGESFPKLSVKYRNEIVTLGLPKEDDIDPNEVTGKYISPEELYDLIHKKKDEFVIVDMRNDYEHKIGHFEGSVLPKMRLFKELPNVIGELENLKNKKVVTVCTGGVRCEKASGYLVKNGFKDVYQLDGGIVTYMEKFKNDDFKGKLYVFDQRMSMTFTEDNNRTIIGRCDTCRIPFEDFINCANKNCNQQCICCNLCMEKFNGKPFCSKECANYIS